MEQLEQIIGYTFQNKKLLKQALTHSSYANEKKLGKLGCNERLEKLMKTYKSSGRKFEE